jgi:hypothetical protein
MSFHKTVLAGALQSTPIASIVETTPWNFRQVDLPQSMSVARVELVAFPGVVGAVNWRRYDPGNGVPRQFLAGSYAIGRRLAPISLASRPFTINRPDFMIEIPPPLIQQPWPQPPGNSGNVPTPTFVDRYWSLYLWLAVGVSVRVWDINGRWFWVRE